MVKVVGTLPPNGNVKLAALIDETNRDIRIAPLFRKPPIFENALVQSIAGGNTMVFNQAARLEIT